MIQFLHHGLVNRIVNSYHFIWVDAVAFNNCFASHIIANNNKFDSQQIGENNKLDLSGKIMQHLITGKTKATSKN